MSGFFRKRNTSQAASTTAALPANVTVGQSASQALGHIGAGLQQQQQQQQQIQMQQQMQQMGQQGLGQGAIQQQVILQRSERDL